MTTIKNYPFVIKENTATIDGLPSTEKITKDIEKTAFLDQFENENLLKWQKFLSGDIKKQPRNMAWKEAALQILKDNNVSSSLSVPRDTTVHGESLHSLLRIASESNIHLVSIS